MLTKTVHGYFLITFKWQGLFKHTLNMIIARLYVTIMMLLCTGKREHRLDKSHRDTQHVGSTEKEVLQRWDGTGGLG